LRRFSFILLPLVVFGQAFSGYAEMEALDDREFSYQAIRAQQLGEHEDHPGLFCA
jgi:hypothetical protein